MADDAAARDAAARKSAPRKKSEPSALTWMDVRPDEYDTLLAVLSKPAYLQASGGFLAQVTAVLRMAPEARSTADLDLVLHDPGSGTWSWT